MIRRDISDPLWHAEVAALATLVAGRGRIVDESYDPVHFGNRIVDLVYDRRRLRMVRDRGQLLTDIGDGHDWHSLETVVAFVKGLAPLAAYDVVVDHDIASVVADNWDGIDRSLDDPRLDAYETAVGQIFFDRLRRRAEEHPVAAE